MKNFIFYLIISLLSLLGILLFVNSQSSNQEILFKYENEDINVKDTLYILVQDSFIGSDRYFDNLIKDFEFQNNINVNLDIVSGSDEQVYNYISKRILNGYPPDILLLSLNNYNAFATENRLLSLTDYLNNYEENYFIPSVYSDSYYNNNIYGLAYYIDPEVLVYNKEIANTINFNINSTINNIGSLLEYYQTIQSEDIELISIPTLIKNGSYIRTVFGSPYINTNSYNQLEGLKQLASSPAYLPYDYSKLSAHSFFNGDSKTLSSIEPLSLIYAKTSNDYSLKNKISIAKISPTVSTNSNKQYISIYSNSNKKNLCFSFLDLFLSENEILNRYKFYNIPVINYSNKDFYLNDTRFDNTNLWYYLENAFHYPISPNSVTENALIDTLYENTINDAMILP